MNELTKSAGNSGDGEHDYDVLIVGAGPTGMTDDVFGSNCFVLSGDRVDPETLLNPEATAAWKRIGGISVAIGNNTVRDVNGSYRKWFDELGALVVLTRPDFPYLRHREKQRRCKRASHQAFATVRRQNIRHNSRHKGIN